jgi:cyclohexanone monooxygenase
LKPAAGVGGTWFWNRYPGARCDIESFQYSYSFSPELEQEWRWTERFAPQEEILAYLNHVADRFSLRDDIIFNCCITSARFDTERNLWILTSSTGFICESRFCVMATGVLSKPREIHLNGQDHFKGPIYSTATWPEHPIDLSDKSVALIGTGASGTQLLPHLVDGVKDITVFQRTPNFSVPTSNALVDSAYEANWKSNYKALREEQFSTPGAVIFDVNSAKASEVSEAELKAEFERRWTEDGGLNFMRSFSDLSSDEASNAIAADFIRSKIAELVEDPDIARKLMPYGYPLDARRLATTDRGFYELFNRPNVRLVSLLEEKIEKVTEYAIVTDRATYSVDAIIMATGFEPMTGALAAMDILGTDGITLCEKWKTRPSAYLGIAMSSLPNLFAVNGPGGPGALQNVFSSSEMVVDWIAECISYLTKNDIKLIEADSEAESKWMEEVQNLAAKTLMIKAPTSGYIYTNEAGERIFLCYSGGYPQYRKHLQEVAEGKYKGFRLY